MERMKPLSENQSENYDSSQSPMHSEESLKAIQN